MTDRELVERVQAGDRQAFDIKQVATLAWSEGTLFQASVIPPWLVHVEKTTLEFWCMTDGGGKKEYVSIMGPQRQYAQDTI